MTLPSYQDLDLVNEPMWSGYYTLGLIKKYRPDIAMVEFRMRRGDLWQESDRDITLLRPEIEKNLAEGRKVLLVSWEEDLMARQEDAITDLCNRYQDADFWFVTEMDHAGQDIYRHYHRLKCRILELPFLLVNQCVTYAKIRATLTMQPPPATEHNYLCMVGRPEKHKFDLARCLISHGLASHGLITTIYDDQEDLPPEIVQVNPVVPPYDHEAQPLENRCAAAQVAINGIWACRNVENFLHIESTYDQPLIINPESTMGIFPATEKSFWPAMLGRMYLIQAQPGAMAYIRRFHDLDSTLWADLGFDQVGGWDDAAHWQRRDRMIGDNAELIRNTRDIYQNLRADLERTRWSVPQNIYAFFVEQLGSI